MAATLDTSRAPNYSTKQIFVITPQNRAAPVGGELLE